MEDDLKKNNGKQPKKKYLKKWKTTSTKNKKNEDDLNKNRFSQFLLNLGETFPGVSSAL